MPSNEAPAPEPTTDEGAAERSTIAAERAAVAAGPERREGTGSESNESNEADEADDAADKTDMSAVGDDGQVFGG
jgi:hypothetical protein